MHQSGPNTHTAANGVPPRWAFLIAYDPLHNAAAREPHPKFGAEYGKRGEHRGSPIWDDDLILEYGAMHLEAAESHARHVEAKKRKESAAKL